MDTDDKDTHLEAFSSAPCSINSMATRLFPPDAAARSDTMKHGIDMMAMGESGFGETDVPVCSSSIRDLELNGC
jgi:hypothetical protein